MLDSIGKLRMIYVHRVQSATNFFPRVRNVMERNVRYLYIIHDINNIISMFIKLLSLFSYVLLVD